ncbi:MAG TPA: inositol monophosphatase family protein [Acidimicrobiales bacterium]|nr:inositol monophosphatase family protein [Acidimicrobiales bacterium]
MTTGEPKLEELLELAVSIALEAGRALSDRFSAAGPTQVVTDSVRSKSSRTDLVTEADQASEHLIVSRLAAARPGDAVLAEESGSTEGTSGLTWVVDPLDGTINFVYGLPVFGVSIACRSNSTTQVGVVHDPIRQETFTALAGGGAYRDGVRLRLDPGPPLGEALVGTGFSYESDRRRAQGRLLAHVLPEVRDLRRAGAAAIDLSWVACGRLDGHYEAWLAPWDHAAGSLLVTEAGGTVEEILGLLAGHEAVPTLVAAAPGLGPPLRDLLISAR